MSYVSPQERIVLKRHNEDCGSAEQFIEQNLPSCRSEPIDMNAVITYAVSTTLNSSVLLIAKGLHSMFTRNTYSADPKNPWIIYQHGQENRDLAQHIQQSWDSMAIDPDGNREEVNKIAPHILYQKVGNNWKFVPLPGADEKNVVRFETNDMVIWSHPPRDKPLLKVVREIEVEDQQFAQVEGDLKRFCEKWSSIQNNANIPNDKKLTALEKQRGDIKKQFFKMYSFYKKLESKGLPNSYSWPTLQLGSRRANSTLQRYGDTFSSVYGTFTNEVHHKFYASGVQARPLPTEETVYGWFTSTLEQFNLSFEDMKA